jgi:hypothetical protein
MNSMNSIMDFMYVPFDDGGRVVSHAEPAGHGSAIPTPTQKFNSRAGALSEREPRAANA